MKNSDNSGYGKQQDGKSGSGTKPDPKSYQVRDRVEKRVVETLDKRK